MNELPDPQQSRAVLIGTSRFRTLAALPSVRNNLMEFAQVLGDDRIWGLPKKYCITVENPASSEDMLDPVLMAAREARDTLLFYYAGHGLVGQRTADLRLALIGSDPDPQRSYTAVPYNDIRDALLDSRAIRRIVILDCCFSGRALGQMADGVAAVVTGASIEGTYVMASTAENKIALAPPQEQFTAFTGQLVNVLLQGIPGRGEFLDLDAIYNWVSEAMREKGLPIPQTRVRNTAGQLGLVRNRAYRAVQPPEEKRQPPVPDLPPGPDAPGPLKLAAPEARTREPLVPAKSLRDLADRRIPSLEHNGAVKHGHPGIQPRWLERWRQAANNVLEKHWRWYSSIFAAVLGIVPAAIVCLVDAATGIEGNPRKYLYIALWAWLGFVTIATVASTIEGEGQNRYVKVPISSEVVMFIVLAVAWGVAVMGNRLL
jgi:caspase domain-containing protein